MQFSGRQWLVVTAVSIAGVDIGLWLFNPQIIWYVGMSGFLHGLLVAGVVKSFRTAPWESLIMGLVVLLKIVYEQLIGPMPGSEQSAGGSVVVDAHLYGALAGAGIAAILWNRKTVEPPKIRTENM
jgi:rhomboid family GlyGly-CTERM serine protease